MQILIYVFIKSAKGMGVDMNEVIRKVAEQNGVSKGEVKSEIKKAIKVAMNSNDCQVLDFWNKISPDGKEPSVENFIAEITAMIIERKYC